MVLRHRITDFLSTHKWVRELIVFGSIYFFLSLINLRVKLFLTPAWTNGTLDGNHAALLRFDYYNNEQSRLLQFVIPEFFRIVFSLNVVRAYVLQRFLFILIAFVCFHFYLRQWFDPKASFAGVAFLAAIMPLTYIDDLQESSSLLLLTFLIAMWAIRDRKLIVLLLANLIGGLNNETMLIVPLVYFLYNFSSFKPRALVALSSKTILIGLPLIVTIGPIRYLTRNQPHLGGAWHLTENLWGIWHQLPADLVDWWAANYLYIFFIFGVFWVFAFLRWSSKPLFLRRAALMMPFFILANLVTGIISEVRQMLPLATIIIPMALFFIFPSEENDESICHVSTT